MPASRPLVQTLVAMKSLSRRPSSAASSPTTLSARPYIGEESTMRPPSSTNRCSTWRSGARAAPAATSKVCQVPSPITGTVSLDDGIARRIGRPRAPLAPPAAPAAAISARRARRESRVSLRSPGRKLTRARAAGDDASALDDIELLDLLGDGLRGVGGIEDDEIGATALGQPVALEAERAGGVGGEELGQPGELVEVAEMRGHGRDQRLAQEIGIAVRRERVGDVIGGDRHVDAGRPQLTETGHAAPRAMCVRAALHVELGGRQADHVDARFPEAID